MFARDCVVRIHYVERHLNCIERKGVFCRGGQMNVRTLVAGEADRADLARLAGFKDGLPRSFGKNAVRIGVANHFVKLEEIDPVSLKAAQGLVGLQQRASLARRARRLSSRQPRSMDLLRPPLRAMPQLVLILALSRF